jgi:hypothetical protein
MREIKFRIYDKIDKEYIDPSDFQISCDDGELYKSVPVPLSSHLSAGLEYVSQSRYIVEQYTGLKDKNGTKIFKGDKVLIDVEVGVIEYDNKNAMFVVNLDNVCVNFSTHNSKWFEIIGNVHEEVK